MTGNAKAHTIAAKTSSPITVVYRHILPANQNVTRMLKIANRNPIAGVRLPGMELKENMVKTSASPIQKDELHSMSSDRPRYMSTNPTLMIKGDSISMLLEGVVAVTE